MKYFLGIIILVFGIYIITDLGLKTRYTRKRLSKKKVNFFNFILDIKQLTTFLYFGTKAFINFIF